MGLTEGFLQLKFFIHMLHIAYSQKYYYLLYSWGFFHSYNTSYPSLSNDSIVLNSAFPIEFTFNSLNKIKYSPSSFNRKFPASIIAIFPESKYVSFKYVSLFILIFIGYGFVEICFIGTFSQSLSLDRISILISSKEVRG